MKLQISAGQGPAECQLAVVRLAEEIEKTEGAELVSFVPGERPGCFRSAVLSGDERLARWEGTVQWICRSPFRPRHGRKNWFVDVSICAERDAACFDESKVRFETFRSSGKGGQHVNRTESGVRAVYPPTGDAAVSTDERSQHQNKRTAVERLRAAVEARAAEAQAGDVKDRWKKHTGLERGNAAAVFEGPEFRRRK